MEFKVGRPSKLDEAEAKRILAFVGDGLTQRQVARLSKTPYQTLENWLKRGIAERDCEERSIFTQFWLEFEHKKAIEIDKMIKDMLSKEKNWGATWEILKAVAKEDFGTESVEFKELSDRVEKLTYTLASFMENQAHGVLADGQTNSKET
jgi:hypothetical protein